MKTLQQWVFDELQDNISEYTEEEARRWVENHAYCATGSVAGLIYYTDTVAFFDQFEDEILELATEYDFFPDIRTLGIQGYKNIMAWFAFEALKDGVFDDRLSDFDFADTGDGG